MKYVTVVSKEDSSEFSLHSSFLKACQAYDWDRKKYNVMPSEIDGYKIEKRPLETPIHCLELIEFCSRKKVAQSSRKEDGEYKIFFDGYDQTVEIMAEYTTEKSDGNEQVDTYGNDFSTEGSDYDILSCITKVTVSYDKTEVESIIGIDKYTEAELILLINID